MFKKKIIYFTAVISGLTVTFLTLIIYFFTGSANVTVITEPSRKILIDHDGGADDSMALFLVFLYEKYIKPLPIPIYRGCNTSFIYTPPSDHFFGQDGLGDLDNVTYIPIEAQPKHAALAIIELSKKYEGELVIVGLGALTNIALAIKLDNLFLSRLSQLYLAAGNVYNKEEEHPEYNAKADVEAYKMVVEKATLDKVTLISSSQVQNAKSISLTWRENVLGAIPTQIMQAQNSFERISRGNQTTWGALDPMAMSFVLNTSLIEEYKFSKNDITLCGDDRGTNINDFEADPNVRLIYSSIGEPYKQFLLEVFSADCNSK